MTTFIEGSHTRATRIHEEEWAMWKETLVTLYTNMTLPEVMSFMEREHGFVATKRQYVHRFQAWQIKKYKQHQNATPARASSNLSALNRRSAESLTASAPSSATARSTPVPTLAGNAVFTANGPIVCYKRHWAPQLDSADDKARQLALADMLLIFGDFPHCFAINAALAHREPSQDYTVACVRTAQTQTQAENARNMVKANLQSLPEENDSWTIRVFEFLLAYTYDWGKDAEHGLQQIAKTVTEIVPDDRQGHDCLKDLAPRGPGLDVLAYVLFRSALVRYNQAHEDDEVDIPDVLRQFINQQPAFHHPPGMETDPLLHIDCLPSCLDWCIEKLCNNPVVPLDIPGADDNPLAEAYVLLCALWSVWLNARPSFQAKATAASLASFPAWADNTKQQLGIPPTELLSTIVCMIVAASPQHTTDGNASILERALAGAGALKKLDSECLIHRFLDQVWTANRWLAFRLDVVHDPYRGTAMAEVVQAARRFVAESLGIYDLPVLEPGAVGYPLVLAGHGLSEDGHGMGSPSVRGQMAASEVLWAQVG